MLPYVKMWGLYNESGKVGDSSVCVLKRDMNTPIQGDDRAIMIALCDRWSRDPQEYISSTLEKSGECSMAGVLFASQTREVDRFGAFVVAHLGQQRLRLQAAWRSHHHYQNPNYYHDISGVQPLVPLQATVEIYSAMILLSSSGGRP